MSDQGSQDSIGNRLASRIGINRAVLALSVGRLGDAVGNSLLFIVVPLFVARLPAPAVPFPETVRAGIVISLFGLVASFGQPFAGALIDRLNRRKPFVVGGLLILCAATAAFALAGRYSDLLILRAVQGLGVAIAVPPTLALLTNSTKKESRGGSMGVFSTFRVAGLAVGPLFGGILNDYLGFDATFFVGAAFTFVGAIMVQLLVEEIRLDPSSTKVREFRIIDTDLLSPALVSLGFATFIMAVSFTLIAPLEQDINQRLKQTATAFGIAFSALMLTRILVQIPLGNVSDRIGRKPLIVAGLVLMAIATAPMGLVRTTWQLALLRVLQGLASAGIAAPVFALAGDMSKSGGEGRQMSIVTMGFGLGAALGTLFAGVLAVVSLQLPFYVAGGASLLIAWLVYHYVYETVQGGQQGSKAKETSRAEVREAERGITIMRRGAEKGLITLKSAHSVHETVNRLGPMLEQGGMKVFDRIDHADGAQAAGMTLRPTTLFIFGNPKGGTPWLQCSQSTGIDLPLKMLIWEDEQGEVWITYNDPEYIAARHNISDCGDIVAETQGILQGLAREAARS